jgi:hypothetical protein
MTRLASAFEDLIADAPDQWWAVFFPIWSDLEAAPDGAATGRTDRHRASGSPGPATAAPTPADDPGAAGTSDSGGAAA